MGATKKFYELTTAQEILKLQTKFMIYKAGVNVLVSLSFDEKMDWSLLETALNKAAERNDSLRLAFEKHNGKLCQYFEAKREYHNIPRREFVTEEDFMKFLFSYRKKPIKYEKGIVAEPHFFTVAGRDRLLVKVAHIAMDVSGANNVLNDVFAVYKAMQNGDELPPVPAQFEDVICNDLKQKFNEEKTNRALEFYDSFFEKAEMPYYAGIHGSSSKLWMKRKSRGYRSMKLLMFHPQTIGVKAGIDGGLINKAIACCEELHQSLSTFLFYTFSLTSSLVNDKITPLYPIELINMRATKSEKSCGGTKAQSLAVYMDVDYSKSFNENFAKFAENRAKFSRYIGVSELLLSSVYHKHFKYPIADNLTASAFSFMPYVAKDGAEFEVHSNGIFVMAAYVACMFNPDSSSVTMLYDCQKKLTSEESIHSFHKKYIEVINTVIANRDIPLDELFN